MYVTHTNAHAAHTSNTSAYFNSQIIVYQKGFKNEKYLLVHTHTTITAATIYSFCYILYSLLCDYYLFVFMCIPTLRAVSEKIFCCNVYILYCVN